MFPLVKPGINRVNRSFSILMTIALIAAVGLCSLAHAQQTNPNKLPPCPKDKTARYHNCFGTSRDSDGTGTGYTGTFKDNQPDGYGTYTSPDRFEYVGEWKEGVMHGKGRFTSPEMTYEGEFKEGRKHGWGKETRSDGTKYDGHYQDNLPHGVGSITDSEGNKYEGNFKNNKRHGLGKYILKNGDTYSGESKDGKFHGQGIYKTADGKKYEGVFNDGKFIGTQEEIVRNNRLREQNLAHPWRVQAQCIKFNCKITEIEEGDRRSDGAAVFFIRYVYASRQTIASIECGVGLANTFSNQWDPVEAVCF